MQSEVPMKAASRAAAWAERARQLAAEDEIAFLANAPVKPEPYYPPLSEAANAPVIRVSYEPLELGELGENRGEAIASMRGHLGDGHDWGREMRVTVLAMDEDVPRYVILEGTEAAIRQAFPDQSSLDAWQTAGVAAMPMLTGRVRLVEPASGTVLRDQRWIPIAWAPRAMQMEYTSRAAAERKRF